MSSKTRLLSIASLSLAFVFGLTFGAFAQDSKPAGGTGSTADSTVKAEKAGRFGKHRFGKRGRFGMGHKMGLRGIELTEAQREQIKAIREANKGNQARFAEIRPLLEAKRNGTITPEQQARLDAFRKEAKERRMAMKQQIEAILTPEQKAKIEANREEMKLRREEFRKKREEFRRQREQQKPTDGSTPEVKKDN
jgi:Spy/CpxP family protein refolding chaperone